MPEFANLSAFNSPSSRLAAMGADLSPRRAITNGRGEVLLYAQTGGVINPSRYELWPDTTLYRFGGGDASAPLVAQGRWWIENRDFEKLLSFAQAHDLSVGMATRCLCLLPPEWSDASRLVRARVTRHLLAWRGLASSLVIPAAGAQVRMLQQNEIEARRLNQLFIPGLERPEVRTAALSIENFYVLDPKESMRGFLYL